jgi:hypothetical protein
MHTRKNPEMRKLLLSYGATEKKRDWDDLGKLIEDRKFEEFERRFRTGVSPEVLNAAYWGEGILAGPAGSGDREVIEVLMRCGARVPEMSKWGRYYYFKHYEIAKLLIENGMNPNHHTWHNVTLLHDMAHAGDLDKARLLLDHGANIDAIDEEYQSTPLGFAARWGNREMVQLLLDRGADPELSGAPWSRPLVWAETKSHPEIAADIRTAIGKRGSK